MVFSFTFPESGEEERNLENRSLISHGSGLFCSACSETDVTSQRTIALYYKTATPNRGLTGHKFVMADAKNLHFEVQYFHLEGAKVHFSDQNRYAVAKRGE